MEGNWQNRSYGKLEDMQAKLNKMRQESVDPNFTDYLMQMQRQLDQQNRQADYLSGEIDRNYQIYRQYHPRFMSQAAPQQQAAPVSQPQPVQQMNIQQSAPVSQPQPVQQMNIQQSAPVSQQQFMQQVTQPQAYPQQFVQPGLRKKSSMEFQVGAGLFCVIGVLFILAAFVMLGITYMNGIVKGIGLYLISVLLILFSELFLRKKLEKFSLGITGLGISSLYAATIVNCLYLHNFNSYVAMAVTLVITVLTILLSRRKDSGIIKVISFLGCYISFLPVGTLESDAAFLTVTGIVLVVNLMTVFLPVKKAVKGVHITHMISNAVFVIAAASMAASGGIDIRLRLLFILSNVLVLGVVFWMLEKEVAKVQAAGQYCDNAGYVAIYALALFAESVFFVFWSNSADFTGMAVGFSGYWFHVINGAYILVALIIGLLFWNKPQKWIQYYAAISMVVFSYVLSGSDIERVVAVLVVFVLSKLLTRVEALKVSEIVITLVTMLIALAYFDETGWYGAAFAAAFLLSVPALYHYKPLYQAIVTFVLVTYLTVEMDGMALLPAVNVGALFLLLLMFNHVRRWRGRWQKIYNYGNLAYMILWCLASVLFRNYLNCGIMLILGTAVVILAFQKKYDMDFKHKYLFLTLFWTYMALVCDIEIAIVTSCIVMGIAIASVVMGFALSRKEVRIYGLVLSILVCIKVLVYDFMETPILERMLLSFVVGVIILAISGIYIVLEKRMSSGGSL